MEQESDADLAKRAARGEDAAFAILLRRYQNAVYEMSCRMLGDRDAGLDAAQEVFLKAHGALDRYDSGRKFSTWILAITRNHCIDQIRKPVHRLSTQLSDEDRLPADGRENPRLAAEHAQEQEIIERAVDELSDNYKEAVVLYHFQGFSYSEAAEVQDVPLGTFMARLHRARKKLRDKLRPLLGADDESASGRQAHQRAG